MIPRAVTYFEKGNAMESKLRSMLAKNIPGKKKKNWCIT
jgi:hypothetical protein